MFEKEQCWFSQLCKTTLPSLFGLNKHIQGQQLIPSSSLQCFAIFPHQLNLHMLQRLILSSSFFIILNLHNSNTW